MRILLIVLVLVVSGQHLRAQDSTTVRVFSRYWIGQPEKAVPGPYFIARSLQPLTPAETEALLLNTSRAISRQVLNGKAVTDYGDGSMLTAGFPDWFPLSDADRITPADFRYDPLWLNEGFAKGSNGKLHSFTALQDARVQGSNSTIEIDGRIILRSDTVLTEDRKRNQLIKRVLYSYLDAANTSLFFGENWSFDYRSGVFQKEVVFTGFGEIQCDDRMPHCMNEPLYTISQEHETTAGGAVLFRKNQVTDVAVDYAAAAMSYRYMNGGPDVGDIPGLLSVPDGTIRPEYRLPFLAALFQYAIKHPEAVFPLPETGVCDSLHPYKNSMEVQGMFTYLDTVLAEVPENPGETIPLVLKSGYTLNDVYAIRFYEDWYFNEATGCIRKKVHGISFLFRDDDKTGMPILRPAGIYIRMR